jgi:very-short-patch-repair endonuclease
VSDLSDMLSFQLRALKIPHEREVKLIPGRRFRTDIYIQPHLAIECDGATWTGGRHTRGAGVETDCEKQNLLVVYGYRPMRFTKQQIKLGHAVSWIQKALQVVQ